MPGRSSGRPTTCIAWPSGWGRSNERTRSPRGRPAKTERSRRAPATRSSQRMISPGRSVGSATAVALAPVRSVFASPSDAGAFAPAACAPTSSTCVRTAGSRPRIVTGSAGSAFASRMPKRAANFASGGTASTWSGSVRSSSAFASGRPASSWRSAGTSTRSAVAGGKGGAKVTRVTCGSGVSGGSCAKRFPSGPTSATRAAAAASTLAVKRSEIAASGTQPARALAADLGAEGGPGLVLERLLLGGRDAGRALDPRAPHELDRGLGGKALPRLQHEDRSGRPIVRIEREDRGADVRARDRDRDALRDAVGGEVGVRLDRRRLRVGVEHEDERLVLGDLRAFGRARLGDGRSAGRELEVPLALDRATGAVAEVREEVDRAA